MPGQTHRQVSDAGPRPGEGQHHADQEIEQQLHHHRRDCFRRFAGELTGWQHLQPETGGANQQAQRRLITGQQLQLRHHLRRVLRQLHQLTGTAAQAVNKLPGVLEDVREQVEAVPHAFDRRPTAGEQAVAHRGSRSGQGLLRPLRLETLPLAAQPVCQLRGQAIVGGKQLTDLRGRYLALDMNPIEPARIPPEGSHPLGIQGDRRDLAAVHRHHIHHDVTQRNVVHRLELALDRHHPALGAPDNGGEKVIVARADSGGAATEADQSLHAHQRRQVGRLAGPVCHTAVPALQLLAVEGKGVFETVELLLDTVHLIHQGMTRSRASRKNRSNMGKRLAALRKRETLPGMAEEISQGKMQWV
ncbi:hypothetical protein SRABI112_04626 [Pseudomonas mediterranea]|nr:hypothetical protein SRABI112_04626 [Pseudomonas mediterranea]